MERRSPTLAFAQSRALRDAGIQARIKPASHCSVVEGTRSIKKGLSEPGDHHGLPAFGRLHTGLRADRQWHRGGWRRSCSSMYTGARAGVQTRRPAGAIARPGAFGNCPTFAENSNRPPHQRGAVRYEGGASLPRRVQSPLSRTADHRGGGYQRPAHEQRADRDHRTGGHRKRAGHPGHGHQRPGHQ